MQVLEAGIPGLRLIRPRVWGDERGFFVEAWRRDLYAELGIGPDFLQDNHSFSRHGTLRGLHFQKRHPQGKLICAVSGEVFDVAVDIRPGSPTFGVWRGAVLTGRGAEQLWIPPGFAHGFLVMSGEAHIVYKCTDVYHPEDEGAIRWDDPDLAIAWPEAGELVISAKDRAAGSFAGYAAAVRRGRG